MNKDSSPPIIIGNVDKEKWSAIIKRFIDVLKINIFLVSPDGQALIMPYADRYGWKLLANSPIGNQLFQYHLIQMDHFKEQGQYREFQSQLDFHNFALPIIAPGNQTLGYLIIGPILLNKRRSSTEYETIAKNLNINPKELMDSMNEVRVVSHVDMKSIIDLLDEVVRYSIQMHLERSKPAPAVPSEKATASNLTELLETLLEVALTITKAECGSIMLINSQQGDLSIRVSRGMKADAKQSRIKIGEGIAGLAAQGNEAFLIHGTETANNRIKPFLKRPEIKHALVSPITVQNRVFGILNLHTKSDKASLTDENLNTIQMLSKLTSAAISSVQNV